MTKEDLKSAKQGELILIEHLNNIGFNLTKEKLNKLKGKTDKEIYQFMINTYNNQSEQKKHEISQNLFESAFNDIIFMICTQLEFANDIEKKLN